MRNVLTALTFLPERLSARAAALIPMIVVLPKNRLGIQGASFELTNAVLVFEDNDDTEEQLCVLHEIAHILDPGWEHEALKAAVKQDFVRCPAATRRLLGRVGNAPLEHFAELSAWLIADMPDLKYLPRSRDVVQEALNWEG